MISHNSNEEEKPPVFFVRVGLTTVTVSGDSRADAIRQARRKLCREMPRMWDVIQSLDESRFQVKSVE